MSKSTVILSIFSALGGAGILFAGNVAFEEYKLFRAEAAQEKENEETTRRNRAELLDEFIAQYEALDGRPRRAGEYIESGRGGSREDVRAVVRHFRSLLTYLINGRLDPNAVASYYGGRLPYWADRFRRIGNHRSPVSDQFSANEQATYPLIGDALASIHSRVLKRDSPFPLGEIVMPQAVQAPSPDSSPF